MRKKFKHVLYQKKKVYNLTVANFYTYFVGLLALLVHNNTERCLSRILKQLKNFKTKTYIIDHIRIILDNGGLKYILERHHPDFWNGVSKKVQTFLPKNMTVQDIEKAIGEVLKQNREKILNAGTNTGQYKGMVNGVERTVGLSNGKIGQFY